MHAVNIFGSTLKFQPRHFWKCKGNGTWHTEPKNIEFETILEGPRVSFEREN